MTKLNLIEALFLVCLALAIVLGVWVALTGCASDGCEPETMRCRGNAVEQCNADEDWYVVEHCDGIEPVELDWTCCYVSDQGVYACVPAVDCEGGAP